MFDLGLPRLKIRRAGVTHKHFQIEDKEPLDTKSGSMKSLEEMQHYKLETRHKEKSLIFGLDLGL